MPDKRTKQPASRTKDRILEAAMARFASASYDETNLRDIASDVGVDVAYVHRSFGSKEKLFDAAVRQSLQQRRRFLAGINGGVGGALARRAVNRRATANGDIALLDIIIRSLLSPSAGPLLAEHLERDFIAPLSKLIDRPSEQRAALIAAFLVGIGILKDVLEIKALSRGSAKQLECLIRQTIEAVMTGDTNAVASRNSNNIAAIDANR